jgi:hypothetical protein
VFTLPARIAAIAYHNKAVVYDLLFKASSQTMLTIAADPKRLGVKIGAARAKELIEAIGNLDRLGPVAGLRRLLQA